MNRCAMCFGNSGYMVLIWLRVRVFGFRVCGFVRFNVQGRGTSGIHRECESAFAVIFLVSGCSEIAPISAPVHIRLSRGPLSADIRIPLVV